MRKPPGAMIDTRRARLSRLAREAADHPVIVNTRHGSLFLAAVSRCCGDECVRDHAQQFESMFIPADPFSRAAPSMTDSARDVERHSPIGGSLPLAEPAPIIGRRYSARRID